MLLLGILGWAEGRSDFGECVFHSLEGPPWFDGTSV